MILSSPPIFLGIFLALERLFLVSFSSRGIFAKITKSSPTGSHLPLSAAHGLRRAERRRVLRAQRATQLLRCYVILAALAKIRPADAAALSLSLAFSLARARAAIATPAQARRTAALLPPCSSRSAESCANAFSSSPIHPMISSSTVAANPAVLSEKATTDNLGQTSQIRGPR